MGNQAMAHGADAEWARDMALQIASARFDSKDAALSADLIIEAHGDTPGWLGLTVTAALADLVVLVHNRWARAVGADPAEGWQALMADVAAWSGTQHLDLQETTDGD